MKSIQKKGMLAFAMSLIACFSFGTVTPAFSAKAEEKVTADEELVVTYQPENGVINAPTVVVDAKSEAALNDVISANEKPSNVILRIDAQCNIISASGDVIDSFADVYTALDKKVIPVLYVAEEAQANAVISYLTETKQILDIAVMSNDADLVGKIKEEYPSARGIVEFDGSQTKEEIVVDAQVNQAITVVVPQSFATVANVSYLQGMFKTVWVRTDGMQEMQLADAVFSGAYGVVAENAKTVYDFYATLPENTYVRTPFVVAHRADVQNCNENSLSGIYSASEGGATHVELDFHVTKDKELVAMHDTSLTRTTNGTGDVKGMTLAQIQKFQIDDHATAEPEMIPTLEDCVRAILETDMIFILELKCSGTEIVQIVYDKLKNDEELAPIFDRMVVITFYTDQLEEMKKVLPEVPTANLNSATKSTFKSVLKWMGQYNTGIDTSYGNLTESFQNDLKDRGIIGWSYTHSTYNDVKNAQIQGLIGLTTNQPTTYKGEVKTVEGAKVSSIASLAKGDAVTLYVTSYDETLDIYEGEVVYLEETSNEYKVIAKIEMDGYQYFTQAFSIPKEKASGCGSVANAALIASMAMMILAFKKSKKNF